LRSFGESSCSLLSIALVVIISKFKVEAMEHFPRSLTISQSAACSELCREYVDPHVIYAFVLWPILHCSIAGLVLHVIQSPYRILNLAPLVWTGGESATACICGRNPFFQSHSAASVQTSSRHRAGLSFLLSGRAACTQIAGLQSNCSCKPGVRGGTSYVRSPAVTARGQLPLS
jgi:hypothetical protein